jgi:hypothetical protein
MRNLIVFAGILLFNLNIFAQMGNNKMSDKDMKVSGSGKLPAGWDARFDHPSAKVSDVQFNVNGNEFQFVSGPAAVYFNNNDIMNGNFEAEGVFFQNKASKHPEAYGIFFGGKDLKAKDQHYYYFLVRQDGKYLIKSRDADKTNLIVDWKANDAVKAKDKNGQTKNTLKIQVDNDAVNFFVNGKQVDTLPKSKFTSTDGQVGLRINHNLNVEVSDFSVKKM